MSRRKLSPAEKGLFACSSLAVLFFAGAGAVGYFVDIEPAWNLPPLKPIPAPNGYDLYAKAYLAFTPAVPAIDAVNDVDVLPPGPAAVRYSLARRLQWVSANQKAFAMMKAAEATPYVAPQLEEGANKDFSHHSQIRELGRIKVAEANTYLLQSRYNDSFTSCVDAVAMTVRKFGERNAVSLVVGSAVAFNYCRVFEEDLPHLTASDSQAARLEKILNEIPPFHEIVRGETTISLRSLRHKMAEPNWRHDIAKQLKLGRFDRFIFSYTSKSALVQDVTAWNDYYFKLAQAPYKTPVNGRPSPSPNPFCAYWTKPLNFEKSQQRYLSNVTWLRMLLLRVHLQAYRQQFGRYPTTLTQLPHKHLSDPFSPQRSPFNYRRESNGYKLWSVGPDGVNNSAKPALKYRNAFLAVPLNVPGDLVISVPRAPGDTNGLK